MTFDRLKPDSNYSYLVTANRRGGRFVAKHVPATIIFGPLVAEEYAGLDGLSTAIEANPWICAQRRMFLAQRTPSWRQWANDPDRHRAFYNSGDRE